jgi:hypothetical protein
MKLFLIIYAAGQIGGVAGPLPYDMAECEARRDEMRANQAQFFKDGINRETGKKATPEEMEGIKHLSFECEMRDEKPSLGDPRT